MVVQEQLYTAEDLWERAQMTGDARLELVRGEIITMPPAGGEHGEIAFDIGLAVGMFVKQHRLGRITTAETGYILASDPHTVRAPDLGFISSERAPEPLPKEFIPFAPDLAVEVVSPNDTARDIHDRVIDFLRAGT
ncbi:MAG: Uma2 family endonuclease, partial [Anaerolineae bacterium]|nr:Uma2 family endonuclease [Anaerolineae bacterium]